MSWTRRFFVVLAVVERARSFLQHTPATISLSKLTRYSTDASEDADKILSSSCGLENITVEEIDALPTIDDLVASGAAKREVFQGTELSSRFHWKTRALVGEFSQNLAPEADTEAGGEGNIAAALLNFPAPVSLTVVGKLAANSAFQDDVSAAVREVTGEEAVLEAKDRCRGDLHCSHISIVGCTLNVNSFRSL